MLGAAVFLVWAAISGWPGRILAVDLEQTRVDTALPAPQTGEAITQTFVAEHDGLSQVELLMVVRGESEGDSWLTLRILDPDGERLVDRRLRSAGVTHNQPYTLRFPRQPHSADRLYTLTIGGTTGNKVSVWGYSMDVLDQGELSTKESSSPAQELRLVSHYQLGLFQALARLAGMLVTHGGLLFLAIVFIFMPGVLVLLLAGRRIAPRDRLAWWGLALALGLSIWPLAWLWLTVFGGRWRPWSLSSLLIAGWISAAALWFRGNRNRPMGLRPPAVDSHHLVLLSLLAISLSVRLLAVRDLAFPPWVDASRHALITKLMSESGQMLKDYTPLLPVDRAPYHFGFHALSASLLQLADIPLPGMLIILGQLLNALAPLPVYGGTLLIARRRRAALLAAFLVALPSFFPAYYATWSRLTQMTAVLILPPALGLTWQLIRGGKAAQRWWSLLAAMAAGLFLVHFRVFLLYLPFAALTWLLSRGRGWRAIAAAGSTGLALISPSVIQLASQATGLNLTARITDYNSFPTGYLQSGWEQFFWWLAAAAFLAAAAAALRGKLWSYPILLLSGWMGLVAILLSGQRLGLPESGLINLNSAYITAFVPISIILGKAASQLWRWLPQRNAFIVAPVSAMIGGLIMASTLLGLRQQITILNPQTILARTQDKGALEWVAANTEPSARIAVNSWRWLGSTWAGHDGGAWIVPLTGRESTTPPADYMYNPELSGEIVSFNEYATSVEDWSDPDAAIWLGEQGVTHIFVGVRGGFFDPAALFRNPVLKLDYAYDGAFVFSLIDRQSPA